MDDAGLTLGTWFWLIVPMLTVFILSILNYIKNKEDRA